MSAPADPFDILSSFSPPASSSPSASPPLSSISDDAIGRLQAQGDALVWRTKDVILIRHGRSTWNEFLGAHKQAEWQEQEQKRQQQKEQKPSSGLRGALRNIVGRPGGGAAAADTSAAQGPGGYPASSGVGDLLDLGGENPAEHQKQGSGGFWQGVRGGLKHVGNALNHAGKLNQVDHPLSVGGLAQARQLRAQIEALVQESPNGPGASLLRCRRWYISPFLRALQTAAYALAPLQRNAKRHGEALELRVTKEANEIIQTAMSLDCQGKKGNVGVKVLTRALAKIAETFEDDEDDPFNQELASSRQEELADVSSTLCAMNIADVAQTWWSDVSAFKKEHLVKEEKRVKKLVQMLLLEDDGPCVGLVAHSVLFRYIIRLFQPQDEQVRKEVRTALRNGAPDCTMDPFLDKVMNCGTLVLTFRYSKQSEEIIKASWLFDGHMESALARDRQTQDVAEDIDAQEEYYSGARSHSQSDSPELL